MSTSIFGGITEIFIYFFFLIAGIFLSVYLYKITIKESKKFIIGHSGNNKYWFLTALTMLILPATFSGIAGLLGFIISALLMQPCSGSPDCGMIAILYFLIGAGVAIIVWIICFGYLLWRLVFLPLKKKKFNIAHGKSGGT